MFTPVDTQSLAPGAAFDLLDASQYSFQSASLLHLGTVPVIALTAALIYGWERGSRVSSLFAAFSVLFIGMAVCEGLIDSLNAPSLIVVAGQYAYLCVSLAVPVLLEFVAVLARIEQSRRWFIGLNWIIGILFAGLAIDSTLVIQGTRQFSWGVEPAYGPLGFIEFAWMLFLMSVTAGDLYAAFRRTVPGSRERSRMGLFSISIALLYLKALDFMTAAGVPIYPVGSLPVLLFVLTAAYVTRSYGMIEFTAQTAAEAVGRIPHGAVLMFDSDGTIQFLNAPAQKILGAGSVELVGKNARLVFGAAFTSEKLWWLPSLDSSEKGERELRYTDPGGQVHDLAFSASPISDNHGRDLAYVCFFRDVTDAKRVERRKRVERDTDQLTGLPNRALFQEALSASITRARDSDSYSFALCFVGLDRMRVINEDLGFSSGDRVLAEIANRLRRWTRAQDMVARVGGDEFGILMETTSGGSEMPSAAVTKLREAVCKPVYIGSQPVHLSISIGVVNSKHNYGSAEDALSNAAAALYLAKDSGGWAIHFATSKSFSQKRPRLESELRRALEQDEFCVHYQPIVDLDQRGIVGFEALVRWQHPQRGLLLPGEFIDFAEKVGLLSAIDNLVFFKACAQLKQFQAVSGASKLSMSINLSEGKLIEDGLVDRVESQLRLHKLEAASVRFELLERVAQIEPVLKTLRELRSLGVGLYVDDFGTGYSSLSRLNDLPITALKIDREFVKSLTLAHSSEKMVSGIVALARNLELGVIAEGASSAEEVRRLQALGCRQIQGFYFSQAVPANQALELLREPGSLATQFAALAAPQLRLVAHQQGHPAVVAPSGASV